MIRLLTAVLLFASFHVVADELKTFSDGQVIEADDFNHNFQKLEQDIADIPAGADGADGVAAGLNCTTDQSIVYRGGAWVCSSPEYVDQFVFSSSGTASCPNDKKVTGGGCEYESDLGFCYNTSRPDSSLLYWRCESEVVFGYSGVCEVEIAYAICQ